MRVFFCIAICLGEIYVYSYKFPVKMTKEAHIIQATRNWIERFVIKLNLCPFALQPFRSKKIRYKVSQATSIEQLTVELAAELRLISQQSVEEVATSLLIHPDVLEDFPDYNDYLAVVDGLLIEMELEGMIQVASFHPDYQFAETEAHDAENYSNRSPYPMLHILREALIQKAVDTYPEVDRIPYRNIERLRALGKKGIEGLLERIV